MNFFTLTKLGRTLLLAAVVAVGSVCWLGCGGDDESSSGGDDNGGNTTGGNSTGGNNTGGGGIKYGTLTDSRDSKIYKTVKIGGQTWMAENLNYDTADGTLSWCCENSADSCKKYGRLYTWNAAKTSCPREWHLPTRDEWGALAKAAGGTGDYGASGIAGKALKSSSDWVDNGNGTNDFGFSALPGGFRGSEGSFDNPGYSSNWWTATEDSYSIGAYSRDMYYYYDDMFENSVNKSIGFSVRCVKND